MEGIMLDYGAIGILVLLMIKNFQIQKEDSKQLEKRYESLIENVREDMKAEKESMLSNGIKRTKEHNIMVEKMQQQYNNELKKLQNQADRREDIYREDIKDYKEIMQNTTIALNSIIDRLSNIENIVLDKKSKNIVNYSKRVGDGIENKY